MKKLKGHTVIELKDIVTGEVEKIESDNLVTNAVQEFLSLWQPLYGWGAISKYFTPLWRNFFSGLYLFDTAQVESASNTFLPNAATAKLVGYAGNATSGGEDTKRGSYNFNESEALVNGYKFVWDFGTSEANGTIASLSLTNPIAGFHGYNYDPEGVLTQSTTKTGNEPSNYKGLGWTNSNSSDGVSHICTSAIMLVTDYTSSDYYKQPVFDIDVQPDGVHWKSLCPWSSETTKVWTGILRTNQLNITDIYGARESEVETISNPGQNPYEGVVIDTGSEIVQLYSYNNRYLYVNVYNRTTYLLTESYNVDFRSQTGKNLRGTLYNYADGVNMVYRNGSVYMIAFDTGDAVNQGYVAKFNLSTKTGSIITPKFSVEQINYDYCHVILFKDVNGNIYAGGYLIDNNDDYIDISVTHKNSSGSVGFIADGYVYHFGRFSTVSTNSPGIIPNLQYLATINNLASPVIKTASKVMKITYTLTEAT